MGMHGATRGGLRLAGAVAVLAALAWGCGDDSATTTVTADPGVGNAGAGGGGGGDGVAGSSGAGGSASVAGGSGGSTAGAAGMQAMMQDMMEDAMQPMDGASANPAAGGCTTNAAAVNGQGILSSHPDISTTVLPATFAVESLSFVVKEDGDPRGPLLTMLLELRNDRPSIGCTFIPDITLDGQELVGLVETPPYHQRIGTNLFSAVSDCLDTGETGVLLAVARGIGAADLQTASSLFVDATPQSDQLSGIEYERAVEEPQLSADVVETADGFALGGTLTPVADIYNYGLTAYARDGQGLLFAELLAFPGELGPLPTGAAVEFETEATPCRFDDYIAYQSWIRDDP